MKSRCCPLPSEMRGRTAYYGQRHVWQLLAIKQLQASGLTLVDIQQRLAGADDRTLKKLARVTGRPPLVAAPAEQPSAASCLPAGKRTTFWAASPAVAKAVDTAGPADAEGTVVRPALHIKLDEGVTLVLEGVERDKLAAVEHAARGLTKELRRLLKQASSALPPVQLSPPTVSPSGRSPELMPDPSGAERIPS